MKKLPTYYWILLLIVTGVIATRFRLTSEAVDVNDSAETIVSVSPASTAAASATSNGVQIIKATYSEAGFSPTRFVVKAGQPVRLEVKSEIDGFGCMGSLAIPDLSNDAQGFVKGRTNIIEVTPPSPGEYDITCAMGIPHGVIVAN